MSERSLEDLREELRADRPIDLDLLGFNEAPHFFGYDIERATDENLDYMPIVGERSGLDFHCEINLFQEEVHQETSDAVCFRYVSARIKQGDVVEFHAHGIPESDLDAVRLRTLAIYRLLYPNGLTLEDMQ